VKSPKILKETAEVLKEVEERLKEVTALSPRKKQRALEEIREARENFLRLSEEAVIDNEELANFFLKRATKLKNSTSNKVIEKLGEGEYMKDVNAMLRYSRAAPYDFAGEIKHLNRAHKAYVWGMVSYFAVTAFLPVAFKITSLILVIPILLSLLSLKRRGYMGFLLAMSSIPIPMITGAIATRVYIDVFLSPNGIQEAAEGLGVSTTTAMVIAAIMLVFGVASVVLLGYAAYMLYKHRHAFL